METKLKDDPWMVASLEHQLLQQKAKYLTLVETTKQVLASLHKQLRLDQQQVAKLLQEKESQITTLREKNQQLVNKLLSRRKSKLQKQRVKSRDFATKVKENSAKDVQTVDRRGIGVTSQKESFRNLPKRRFGRKSASANSQKQYVSLGSLTPELAKEYLSNSGSEKLGKDGSSDSKEVAQDEVDFQPKVTSEEDEDEAPGSPFVLNENFLAVPKTKRWSLVSSSLESVKEELEASDSSTTDYDNYSTVSESSDSDKDSASLLAGLGSEGKLHEMEGTLRAFSTVETEFKDNENEESTVFESAEKAAEFSIPQIIITDESQVRSESPLLKKTSLDSQTTADDDKSTSDDSSGFENISQSDESFHRQSQILQKIDQSQPRKVYDNFIDTSSESEPERAREQKDDWMVNHQRSRSETLDVSSGSLASGIYRLSRSQSSLKRSAPIRLKRHRGSLDSKTNNIHF